MSITITADQAAQLAESGVFVVDGEQCPNPNCHQGHDMRDGEGVNPCPTCRGGTLDFPPAKWVDADKPCEACGGMASSSFYPYAPCFICHGTGRTVVELKTADTLLDGTQASWEWNLGLFTIQIQPYILDSFDNRYHVVATKVET